MNRNKIIILVIAFIVLQVGIWLAAKSIAERKAMEFYRHAIFPDTYWLSEVDFYDDYKLEGGSAFKLIHKDIYTGYDDQRTITLKFEEVKE